MAQFIRAQGQPKPLFNGDGMLIGFEPRDPSAPMQIHKRKIRFNGSSTSTRLFAYSSSSSSSSVSSSGNFKFKHVINGDESFGVGYDEFLEDSEYGSDDLSCFRGLVLDISYRSVFC